MYIAIDIGGTNTRIASFAGIDPTTQVNFKKIQTAKSYQEGFENLKDAISEVSNNEKIDSVGISIASVICLNTIKAKSGTKETNSMF